MPRARDVLGFMLVLALVFGCAIDREQAKGKEGLLKILIPEGPRPAELARMAMNDYDPNARYIGTFGLANAYFASDPVYLALFEDNADDDDPSVRAAAIRGLANHGEPVHVPILVTALADPDRYVRIEAARGLQRLHNPVAIDALVAATRAPGDSPLPTDETEAEVRAEAAVALGQYAEGRVVEALIAALRDESLAVNAAARASLRTLTGQDFGLDHPAWVAWRGGAPDLFAARTEYTYPAFSRAKFWYEYLPFIPRPPNETPGPPAGMPRVNPG
jgi:hypothetical protein